MNINQTSQFSYFDFIQWFSMCKKNLGVSNLPSSHLQMHNSSMMEAPNPRSPRFGERALPETPVTMHVLPEVPQVMQRSVSTQTRVEWRSCCFVVDPRIMQFIVLTIMSFTVLLFCMFQLLNKALSCSEVQMYMPMLTFILGIFIPTPNLKK